MNEELKSILRQILSELNYAGRNGDLAYRSGGVTLTEHEFRVLEEFVDKECG